MGGWVGPAVSLGHFEGKETLLRLLEILVEKRWVEVT
jgi:hypothetical protein